MKSDYPCRYADYVLLERLGQGGMSEVDLARKLVDKEESYVRFTVIKRIKTDMSTDEAFIRMFKDEARITSELHHENIGQVYDFGKEGMDYYMALEYVPGIDIRYLINVLRERGQRVPVKVALKVICDVLSALEYAHNKRDTLGKPMEIVHRDVNPRNVMLSIRGDVKLIDFGVAKATNRLERTRTDHVKGKFSYMAPEQISGQEIDGRADLYAVGLTLHEFLAGHSPFYGLNQIQIMHRMMSGQVADMPRVPELPEPDALKAVHDQALARDPKKRFSDAASFRKAIEEVARQVGGLPSREQMASFLASVDPELITRIQTKMEAYAALELTSDGDIAGEVPSQGPMQPLMPTDVHGTIAGQSSYTGVTRTGLAVVGGSVVAVSLVSALTTLGVAALLAGGWWFMQPSAVAVPEPAPVLELPKPELPVDEKPVAVPDPAPDSPQPDVRPQPQPDVRPQPKPDVRPQPQPQPVPEPVVITVPAPEPQPAEPVPKPEPAVPVPQPAAETGTLFVTAEQAGLMVYIDGKALGLSTPLKGHDLPVGIYQVHVEGFPAKPVRIYAKQRAQIVFK